jgi:hypothetical protein
MKSMVCLAAAWIDGWGARPGAGNRRRKPGRKTLANRRPKSLACNTRAQIPQNRKKTRFIHTLYVELGRVGT